jgi:hypothetical protein
MQTEEDYANLVTVYELMKKRNMLCGYDSFELFCGQLINGGITALSRKICGNGVEE